MSSVSDLTIEKLMMRSIVLFDLQLQYSSLKIKIFIIKNPRYKRTREETLNKFAFVVYQKHKTFKIGVKNFIHKLLGTL